MSTGNDKNTNKNVTNASMTMPKIDTTTPPKVEHDIEKFPGRQLTEDESHQLLRELGKEEVTLKQLIYEFTLELEKTKMEEQMLKNLIRQKDNPFAVPIMEGDNDNNNNQHDSMSDIDEDFDIRHVQEDVDGDMQLLDIFQDILDE